MLLSFTPDPPLPTSSAQGFGACWGLLPSPAPECSCVRGPFRLSQIWSLNEEEKGKTPKSHVGNLPRHHICFSLPLFGTWGWDGITILVSLRPCPGSGLVGMELSARQAFCGGDSRASSHCHPYTFPKPGLQTHISGSAELILQVGWISFYLVETTGLMENGPAVCIPAGLKIRDLQKHVEYLWNTLDTLDENDRKFYTCSATAHVLLADAVAEM